jgi:hypothetical protein
MKWLIACEYSGIVRDAIIARGHEAVSCDLLDTERPGPHYKGNVFDIIDRGWDGMIAHPPCTYLCNSGVRWLHTQPGRWGKMEDAAEFFARLLHAPIPMVGVENPVMHKHAKRLLRQQDFTVQPWQFGDDFKKRTCFWTRGLPRLVPTSTLDGSTAKPACHRESPGPNRWKNRSRTYQGIADAIADQWTTGPRSNADPTGHWPLLKIPS